MDNKEKWLPSKDGNRFRRKYLPSKDGDNFQEKYFVSPYDGENYP